MILVTCVTIPLETATSPFLVPTTTLNLKSPPPLCRGHGEYPLRGKPRKLTPPSPPQPQPPLRHPPTQHEPAASLTTQTLSLPLPSLRDVGIRGPCHIVSSTVDHNNDTRMGVLTKGWAYRDSTGCRRIDSRMGVSAGDGGRVYQQQAYRQWAGVLTAGRHIDYRWQDGHINDMADVSTGGGRLNSRVGVSMTCRRIDHFRLLTPLCAPSLVQKDVRRRFTNMLPRLPHSSRKLVYLH